jgi:predicted  nucleic acid-binding Zn-ribbon protein
MRHWLRQLLGTEGLIYLTHRVLHRIHHLEELMAKASEQLNLLNDKVSDIRADFDAFKTAVETGNSTLDAEAQEAYDRLAANLGGLDTAVGDADGSDAPVVDEPATPVDEDTTRL